LFENIQYEYQIYTAELNVEIECIKRRAKTFTQKVGSRKLLDTLKKAYKSKILHFYITFSMTTFFERFRKTFPGGFKSA
jgi:hypothetical protein